MSEKPYNQIKKQDIDLKFLTGPGEDLIPKLIMQLAKVEGFTKLFGKLVPDPEKNIDSLGFRWADYNRFDWSTRQLPAICLYESDSESKESDNAFLNGTITIQVYWPPNFRRADNRRVESAFKGAIENFFASKYTFSMLDEIYFHERPEKVHGLNQIGNNLTWTPNVEGLIGNELVPVSMVSIQYRIDLRAWYRSLEYHNRTKAEPFKETLSDLIVIGGLDSVYQGIDNDTNVHIEIADEIKVNQ